MSENIVVLTVTSQLVPGEKVFRLDKKRIVFGSANSSDVCLQHQSVSSVHAILEVSGEGKYVIYDLASETGIRVNGKPTIQETLTKKDTLQIGPYLIEIKERKLSEVPAKPLLESEAEIKDIFDRRPETKNSLQVVMFYKDTILNVEHFVDKKRIVIGPGSKEDFAIPPFLGKGKKGRFELVTQEAGQYYLHLHDQMQGVIGQAGKICPIQEVKRATPKGYLLTDQDFAKVKLNDVSFFLNFSPAPPRLKTPKLIEQDPTFFKIWVTSIFLTCLIFGAMGSITVNPTIEVEQIPERVATIIYEPRLLPMEPSLPVEPLPPTRTEPIKITVEPKRTTVPAPKNPVISTKSQKLKKSSKQAKAAPLSGKEGAGVKARGKEGSRGKPVAMHTGVPQTKAQRPGEGKPGATSTNKGHSQTQGLGIVDVFKSNQGVLSKLFAGASGVTTAAKNLEGYSGFTTRGAGGLGVAGSEKGGGGSSMGLGGLSTSGPGGGKKGTGLGALGNGGNLLGASGMINIESGGTPEPVILGNIDRDAIAREMNKHRDEFKYCYEKEINAERPDLAGRVGVQFVIGASGMVSSAGISSTSLNNANIEKCITEVIKNIVFPPIPGGGIAEVKYPFVFKTSTK